MKRRKMPASVERRDITLLLPWLMEYVYVYIVSPSNIEKAERPNPLSDGP